MTEVLPPLLPALGLQDGLEIKWIDTPDQSQYNANLDDILGQEVATGARPPLIRLWRSGFAEGLSVSRKDVAGELGQRAATMLRERGLDVVVRQTGGTAVPQGEGVFHVSWLLPRSRASVTTDAYFRLLCQPVLDWLAAYGIAASTGSLAGSYCDGSYNILAAGRKLAGTAQAWKGGLAGLTSRYPGYVVAHACIATAIDIDRATGWINAFYAAADNPYQVQPDTTTSLSQLLPCQFGGNRHRDANWRAQTSLREFLTGWLSENGVSVLSGTEHRPLRGVDG